MATLKLSIDPKAVSRHSSIALGDAASDDDFDSVGDFREAIRGGEVEATAIQQETLEHLVREGFTIDIGEDGTLTLADTGNVAESFKQSSVLQAVPPTSSLLAFTMDVVRLLYADIDTGKLTGENTVSSRSCADFLDALEFLLSRHGIHPRLEAAMDR
jgi:hypothetical protein